MEFVDNLELLNLPSELVLFVLERVELTDVPSVACTCKLFNQIVNEASFWIEFCRKYLGIEFESQKMVPFISSNNWKRYFAIKYLMMKKGAMNHQLLKRDMDDWIEARSRCIGSKIILRSKIATSRTNRSTMEVDEIEKEIFVYIGGHKQSNQVLPDIMYFTPEAKNELSKFELKNNFKNTPAALARHSSCVVNNKIYIFGGGIILDPNQLDLNSVKKTKTNLLAVVDPNKNSWKWINGYKGTPPPKRSDSAQAAIGRKIYIFGGSSEAVKPMNDLWEYDTLANCWTNLTDHMKGTIPPPRSGHTMVALGNRLFVYGGAVWTGDEWVDYKTDFHMYNTESREWTRPTITGPSFNTSIFCASFTMADTFIWIVGGGSCHGHTVLEEIRVLDTVQWTVTGSLLETNRIAWDRLIREFHQRKLSTTGCSNPMDFYNRLKEALEKEADKCLPIGGTKLLPACSEVALESGGRVYLWGGFCGEPTKNLRCLTMNFLQKLRACGMDIPVSN